LIENYTVASEARLKVQNFAMKANVYRILLWEADGVWISPCYGPRFGPRSVIWVAFALWSVPYHPKSAPPKNCSQGLPQWWLVK